MAEDVLLAGGSQNFLKVNSTEVQKGIFMRGKKNPTLFFKGFHLIFLNFYLLRLRRKILRNGNKA